MTIKRYIYALCFILFFSATGRVQGQYSDFQSWWELELDKELSPKLSLGGELEQRFRNNSLQYRSTLLTLSTSYKAFDFLRLAGGARTTFTMNGEQNLQLRYRFNFDVSGHYDLSDFNLSLRTRLQYGFDEWPALAYSGLNSMVNRNRFKVAHHIFGTKIGWFASVESFHGFFNYSQWRTFAMRYSAGASYKLSFSSRFSLRYILEDEINLPVPRSLHILVLAYSYEF